PARDVPPIDRAAVRASELVALELSPSDPTVEVVDAARPTLAFRARGTQRDGLSRALTTGVRFSLDDPTLGAIDATTGVFTPSGVGGVSRVRLATVDGSALAAETSVTVTSRRTVRGAGVTDAMVAAIGGAALAGDGTPTSPLINDPLQGAVMPRNVFPPDLQWTPRHPGAANGDVYRVHLQRAHAAVDAYFVAAAGFRHEWSPEAALWSDFAQSDVGTPIALTVRVLARATAYQSAAREFRTVDAFIAGSVYSWSPSRMALTRLDVESARVTDFLPHPGDTCIGCHSVSRDGQRLSGFLEGTGENLALYDLSRDLTANPAPTVARLRYTVRRCTSFNADGTRLVSGDCGANPTTNRFTLIDAATGREVPAAAGSAGDGFDPEWSPDGGAIAFTNRTNQLSVTPVTGSDRFGAARVIHTPGSTPDGAVDWHPTWTPDSRWIAFQRGDSRRSGVAMDGTGVRGSLWMIARDGGAPVALRRASAGGNGFDTWRPIFSPFDSGGYFWLLFTTLRPYGNALAGTRNLKQIWVAAINRRPDGTTDPSQVGFYLSGQERVNSLSPYWTPAPCRPTGRGCQTGADCCTGACEPDSAGARVCVPPMAACRPRGQMCERDSDCCSGLACSAARLCDLPSPG
ncbi:MAG: tolB protein precursor, partial [Myxococcaceae bacterium]|nr:tolB protein precursor [Myxococcaceae bacterium]